MSDPTDLQSRSRLLFVAALIVDVAAIAALLLPLASGGDVTDQLPLAISLFVLSSGLVLASIHLRKKADAAGGAE